LLIVRSTADTMVVTVETLFSSVRSSVFVVAVTVFVNSVPEAVLPGMLPVSVIVVEPPAGYETLLQLIVPPAPTAGVVQVSGVPVCDTETKVIVPGSVSETSASSAASGPPFASVIV
jgi:hypothetical protein